MFVRVSEKSEKPVPVFGGPAASVANVAFICPRTGELFTVEVQHPPHGEIIGPADAEEVTPVAVTSLAASPGSSVLDAEYEDWIKASRSTALDFCKTMLGVTSSAVPVYFAVLKYVGVEKSSGAFASPVAIAPPLLFLLSSIIFSMALRPRLESIRASQFAEFRRSRFKSLQRLMLFGLATFSAGVLIAIVLAGGLSHLN